MRTQLGKFAVFSIALSLAPAVAQGAGAGMGSANAGAQSRGAVSGQIGTPSVPSPATAPVTAQNNANTGAKPGVTSGDKDRTAAATQAQEKAATLLGSSSFSGNVSAYDAQMKSALAMADQTQRDAAITRARQQLGQSTSKPLTSSTIARLDSTLSIQGASPTLGATD